MSVLVSCANILEVVGDIIRVQLPAGAEQGDSAPRFDDLAVLQNADGSSSLAQVIDFRREPVAL